MTPAAVVQAAASLVGFVIVIYQIYLLIRNGRNSTQDNLYVHYMDILKLFLAKPYLRPFFYENREMREPDPAHPHLRNEIDLASEAILGLIEQAALQDKDLPRDTWQHCWLPYAHERLEKSSEIHKFFDANRTWYTESLCEIVDSSRKTRKPEQTASQAHSGS